MARLYTTGMEQKQILTSIVALITGLGTGHVIWGMAPQKPVDTTASMDHSAHGGMQMEMNSMMASLEGKTGDEFDQVFLEEMIVHHEGAVDMAEAALANAQHAEIKELANAIIATQTTEIAEMRDWLTAWYGE